MKDCIFCKIVSNELPSKKIYEDEKTLAFLDIAPISEGHCLIIPKKHSQDLSDTEPEYLKAVVDAKLKVVKILDDKLINKPTGYNFISNQGSEAFQVVFHYHEHIVPKYVKKEGYVITVNKNTSNLSVEEIHNALIKE